MNKSICYYPREFELVVPHPDLNAHNYLHLHLQGVCYPLLVSTDVCIHVYMCIHTQFNELVKVVRKYLISHFLDTFKGLYRRDPLHGHGFLVGLISCETN